MWLWLCLAVAVVLVYAHAIGFLSDVIYTIRCRTTPAPILLDSPRRDEFVTVDKPALLVFLHGHNDIPQAWRLYYHDKRTSGHSIYVPHVRRPADRERVLMQILEYTNKYPDEPVVIFATSMGSILGARIHAELLKRKKRSFLISIVGVFYGTYLMDLAVAVGLAYRIFYGEFVRDLCTWNKYPDLWRHIPPETVYCFYNSYDYKVIPSSSSIINRQCGKMDMSCTGHSAIVDVAKDTALDMMLAFVNTN